MKSSVVVSPAHKVPALHLFWWIRLVACTAGHQSVRSDVFDSNVLAAQLVKAFNNAFARTQVPFFTSLFWFILLVRFQGASCATSRCHRNCLGR